MLHFREQEFRNTFTQTSVASLQDSARHSVNSSLRNSHENMFSSGGSLPTTSAGANARHSSYRSANPKSISASDPKRSKSIELNASGKSTGAASTSNQNLKNIMKNASSTSASSAAPGQLKKKPYNSTPHLNTAGNDKYNDNDVMDLTDDSDMD